MDIRILLQSDALLVDYVLEFFLAQVKNKELYDNIISECATNPFFIGNSNHKIFLSIGVLSTNDFLFYADKNYKRMFSLKPYLVEIILDKLCEFFVFTKDKMFQYSDCSAYKINKARANYFINQGAIKNIIFGFGYIAQTYSEEVCQIVVVADDDNEHIGTGFIFKFLDQVKKLHTLVITNNHVAKYEKNLKVFNHQDESLEYINIFHSESKDLSIIELKNHNTLKSFNFYEQTAILDEIITLGYPPVGTTKKTYQLAHKGEINAFVEDYWGNELILFSAKTSPGNSGGPLINNMGLVVGIVVQSLEIERADDNKYPYYSALTAKSILEFINDEYLENKKIFTPSTP